MEQKTKDIAIVSLEEWEQLINQVLEEQTDMVSDIMCTANDTLVASVLCNVASLIFAKTTNSISKKLFPDAKLIKNEKGELKWK